MAEHMTGRWTLEFRLPTASRWFVVSLVTMLLVSTNGWAAPKLYDMDRLLFEPHPFLGSALTGTEQRPVPRSDAPSFLGVGTLPPAQQSPDLQDFDVAEAPSEISDPLEPVNRFFFGFNEVLNRFVLGPVARGYNAAMPDAVREGISNFFDNLNTPVILANDLLQGEFGRAWDTTARMAVNTTAGVGGFFDVADRLGFKEHSEDFGQTLAVWGVGEGFYLVLPLFGPSTPRDAVGKLYIDSFFDPLGYYLNNTEQTEISYARTGVGGLVALSDVIGDLDTLRETSVDFYGALRSLYRQQRLAEIRNTKGQTEIPNFDVDLN